MTNLANAIQPAVANVQNIAANVPLSESAALRVDSRRVEPGDVFVALAGSQKHGLAFAEQAAKNGAVAVLSDRAGDKSISVPVIEIPGLAGQLYGISERFYALDWACIRVLAVTGTNGKTSVSFFLRQAAERLGLGGCQIGTVIYEGPGMSEIAVETTPHFVEIHRLLRKWQSHCNDLLVAIEVSSHALDQQRIGELPVDVAVWTNLSREHLDYHSSLDDYGHAKSKLFTQPAGFFANSGVVDFELANTSWSREIQASNRELLYFGGQGDWVLDCVDIDGNHANLTISGTSQVQFSIATAAVYQQQNALTAFTALTALQVDPKSAATSLNNAKGMLGRMELVRTTPGRVFVDYAHTPAALAAALQSARTLTGTDNKLICVFGCGGDRDQGKRPEMGKIAESMADVVIVTSDNPRHEPPEQIVEQIINGMHDVGAVSVELDRRRAIRAALEQVTSGDVVLIAGKGHETGQMIGDQQIAFSDQDEIRHWGRQWEQQ